ncbi:hypothetical protein AMECASPLE_025656 [Ameca splendens]|uniref:Uncharacterized protein n=1 Tax=Ameca splendens TaxID=208324 RepID=A0ABV0YS34_9TELE
METTPRNGLWSVIEGVATELLPTWIQRHFLLRTLCRTDTLTLAGVSACAIDLRTRFLFPDYLLYDVGIISRQLLERWMNSMNSLFRHIFLMLCQRRPFNTIAQRWCVAHLVSHTLMSS